MKNSIFIALACCLFSCGMLKDAAVSKNASETHERSTAKTKQSVSQEQASLFAQTFFSNDSSETLSIMEIYPKGALTFTEGKGFALEASSIRILTKNKTGSSIAKNTLKSDQINLKTEHHATNTTEKTIVQKQKYKETKLPTRSLIYIVAIGCILLFCLLRYRKKLAPFI